MSAVAVITTSTVFQAGFYIACLLVNLVLYSLIF